MKGVKGYSWVIFVPQLDIIRAVAIDYMHGTLLGVTKMLLTLAVQKYFPVQIFEKCCVCSQNPLHRCDTCDQEFVRAYN